MIAWLFALAWAGDSVVTWQTTARGPDKELVEVTQAAMGPQVSIRWMADGARVLQYPAGFFGGTWVAPGRSGPARLLPLDGGAPRDVRVADMDDAAPEVRAILTSHFKVDLVDTGETATLLGVEARRYTLASSAFTRGPTELWIAPSVQLPRARLDFEAADPLVRGISPLVLSLPQDVGLVLRAVTVDQGVEVTFEAITCTPCGTPDDGAATPGTPPPATPEPVKRRGKPKR